MDALRLAEVRAAIAPVAGGQPRAFGAGVMPKIGAGHGPLGRARLVMGMLRTDKDQIRAGLRAHCELGDMLSRHLGMTAGVGVAGRDARAVARG